MTDEPRRSKPNVTKYSSKRRRMPRAPSEAPPIQLFPGLHFRIQFVGRRNAVVDLSWFPRRAMAEQVARLIWKGWSEGSAYQSAGPIASVVSMMRKFGEFLSVYDPSAWMQGFDEIQEADVDAFDEWLHAQAYEPGAAMPYIHLAAFVKMLNEVVAKDMAPSSLLDRLRFVSKGNERKPFNVRDAYCEVTMANLRAAARADTIRILARMRMGRRLARQGQSPERGGWRSAANVQWEFAHRGMVTRERFKILESLHQWQQFRIFALLDMAFPRQQHCMPFLILLADATGLPIECVRELKADCLVNPTSRSGFSPLRYVKRRQTRSEEPQTLPFPIREPYSAGWLVRRVLLVTAPIRRALGLGEREGPLFLFRNGFDFRPITSHHSAANVWVRRHPVVDGQGGGALKRLHLSRIRKSFKAMREYVPAGGRLGAIRSDHTVPVFVKHYGNIPFLKPRHDDAIEAGIQEAHDVAMRPHVLLGEDADRLVSDPGSLSGLLGATEHQIKGVGSGENDAWTAGCLDFHDSPFAAKGRPCGGPVFGCLDCANAVVTASKLPSLVRLLNHVVERRQQMRLDDWQRNYGFVFVRLRQIMGMFTKAEVAAAIEEAAEDQGRDWTMAQLAYRMGGDA